MGFEPFEEKRVKRTEPNVSISKQGNFHLNAACIREYFSGYKHVKLFWDAFQKRIGIKPMKTPDEHCYNVHINPRGSIGTFSGSAFLKKIGIDYSETRAFPASWNTGEKLIELSVADVIKKTGRESS